MLIRAWMHPAVANHFIGFLEDGLRGYRETACFAVNQIYRRYTKPVRHLHPSRNHARRGASSPLDFLNEEVIRAIEAGNDPARQSDFEEAGLIVDRPRREGMIRFFAPIQFADISPQILSVAVSDLIAYLSSEESRIQHWSVYGGSGACSLVVTRTVHTSNYEDIGVLPNWIGARFHDSGATTQTSLAFGLGPDLFEGRIGEATFREIEGRDLFVHSILPELEDIKRNSGVIEIEQFLRAHVQGTTIPSQYRNLLHDVFWAHAKGEPSEAVKSLMIFFIDVEAYLRANLDEFLANSLGSETGNFRKRFNVDGKSKNSPLGTLLDIYVHAIRASDREPPTLHAEAFAHVRNQIAHDGVIALANWKQVLGTVVTNLIGLRQLLSAVQENTKRPFAGTY